MNINHGICHEIKLNCNSNVFHIFGSHLGTFRFCWCRLDWNDWTCIVARVWMVKKIRLIERDSDVSMSLLMMIWCLVGRPSNGLHTHTQCKSIQTGTIPKDKFRVGKKRCNLHELLSRSRSKRFTFKKQTLTLTWSISRRFTFRNSICSQRNAMASSNNAIP